MLNTNTMGESQPENSIDGEIRTGEIDEKSIESQGTKKNFPAHTMKHVPSDKNEMKKKKDKICREKLHASKAATVAKTIKVPVYQKRTELPKRNYFPRHCMTKEEWINFMSTCSRKCSSNAKTMKDRSFKAIPMRINELAQPPRQRIIATLENRGMVLPTHLVDRLITVLETQSTLSPEQVEELFQIRKKRKKRKSKRNEQRMQSSLSSEVVLGHAFDKDATTCQYFMAEALLKNILELKSTIPANEFQDITRVILNRLEQLFHLTSVDTNTRISQQMHLLADIIAAWIAGILLEITKSRESGLNSDCEIKYMKTDDVDDDEIVIDMRTVPDAMSTRSHDEDDSEEQNGHEYEDYEDDNNDTDSEGNVVSAGYVNLKYDDGNTARKVKHDGKSHDDNRKGETSKISQENLIESDKEVLTVVHDDPIIRELSADIKHPRTLFVMNTSNWYRLQKKLDSQSFIWKRFHTSSTESNSENMVVLAESNTESKNERHYSPYLFIEREINPSF